MEKYTNEINIIEQSDNWLGAISLLRNQEISNVNVTVRGLFVIAYFLVEGQYNSSEYKYMTENLQDFYNKAKIKFTNNSQFLFFSAITIYLGEWYFNLEIDIAEQMLEKAKNLEPNNILYEWGYIAYINQNSNVNTKLKLELSEKLLYKTTESLILLQEFGSIGSYIKGILENSYENLSC